MAKRKIHQNVWGNWNGYESGRRVIEFGTDEQAAREWLDNISDVSLIAAAQAAFEVLKTNEGQRLGKSINVDVYRITRNLDRALQDAKGRPAVHDVVKHLLAVTRTPAELRRDGGLPPMLAKARAREFLSKVRT